MIERTTLALACISLVAIMVLIFLDGALRYLLNSPLTFAVDVVTLYLISAAFLMVLSYTLRRGGHISVDVFMYMMNNRLQNFLFGAVLLCSVPVVAVMSYQMSLLAWESWVMGEVLIGLYPMPIWLSKAIVAAALIVLNVRLLHLGICNFLAGITGDRDLAFSIRPVSEHAEEEMV